MKSLIRLFAIIFMDVVISRLVYGSSPLNIDQGMTCAVCTVLATLVFEHPDNSNYAIALKSESLCNALYGSNETLQKACLQEAHGNIDINPDKFCEKLGLCNSSCKLFVNTTFPPSPLPPSPPNDPPNRDLLWDDSDRQQMLAQWHDLKMSSNNHRNLPFYEFNGRIVEVLLQTNKDLG